MALGTSLPARLPESTGTVRYAATSGNDTTGNGTVGNPWATVAKLVANLAAGEIGRLRGGTYGSGLTSGVTWSAAGTALAPITLENYPGETVEIKQRIKITGQYLRLRGNVAAGQRARHLIVSLNNLNGVGDSNVWVAENAQHIELFGVEIKNSHFQGLLVGQSSNPGATVTDVQVISCELHDNGTRTSPADHDIYYGTGGTVNGAVYNCLIYSALNRGIQFYDAADGLIVACNSVDQNGKAGIQPAGGPTRETDNSATVNNIVTRNSDRGLRSQWDGATGTGNVGHHNLGYANTPTNFTAVFGGLTLSANIDGSDPLFTDADGRDYSLLAGSPAAGAGDDAYTPTFDFIGRTRSAADIGAYAAGDGDFSGAFSLPLTFGVTVSGSGTHLGSFTLALNLDFRVSGSGLSVLPVTAASLTATPATGSPLTLVPATNTMTP